MGNLWRKRVSVSRVWSHLALSSQSTACSIVAESVATGRDSTSMLARAPAKLVGSRIAAQAPNRKLSVLGS